MARKFATPCVGEGMIERRVILRARDVVFFEGVLEASDGLAAVFAEHGGDLTVSAPEGRQVEPDAVLGELSSELGAMILP